MLQPNEQARFCKARRAAIEQEFLHLNPEQRQAVLTTEGPLLLLAGAGSGKTTVLIHRIANLLQYGCGSDCSQVPDWATKSDLLFLEQQAHGSPSVERERLQKLCAVEPASPWSILAITFTNKAADELKDRLASKLGETAHDIWASTFHSACTRILRRDIDKLGYSRSFTIYDASDSKQVIQNILHDRNISEKTFPSRAIQSLISRAKDEGMLAEDYQKQCASAEIFYGVVAEIYTEYEKRLKEANALDFDDLILQTVLLLRREPSVREFYQKKFRYVLVDEYQDTNDLQDQLISLLAGGRNNLCVVGDDDQSIYRFRGANIENILSFDRHHAKTRVIRLEQNYRSTQNILEAANGVIHCNHVRKKKALWTKQGQGEKVRCCITANQSDEAQYVAQEIRSEFSKGRRWSDFALLYRMNAQSRELEMALQRNGIPYRIISGMRFFDRAEVKDMLAYLCVVHNPHDDLRLLRILNNPPRGIGQKTIDTIQQVASENGLSLWEVLQTADQHPLLQKAAAKLMPFVQLIQNLQEQVEEMSLLDFYHVLCADSGYTLALQAKATIEDQKRLENVRELGTSIQSYMDYADTPTLAGFLDEISLYTNLDSYSSEEDCVLLMTVHSAKGLEFPVVFLVGMEEGIFPLAASLDREEEIEEERRLCYVAMTRAKEKLYLIHTAQRVLYERTSTNRLSRFLKEIPSERIEWIESNAVHFGHVTSERDWRPERQTYPSVSGSRRPPVSKARWGDVPARKPASPPDFQVGNRVRHKAFGEGLILKVQENESGILLEIAFDDVGTKRLYVKSAAPYMNKLPGMEA